jgi:hypothetical protein
MIQIGYTSARLERICTKQKDARKALSHQSADLVTRRLTQLSAFENLGQIPFRSSPLHFHPLREDASGTFVIKLHAGDGIVFRPVGEFSSNEDGSPNLATVNRVEIEFVGNYHGRS